MSQIVSSLVGLVLSVALIFCLFKTMKCLWKHLPDTKHGEFIYLSCTIGKYLALLVVALAFLGLQGKVLIEFLQFSTVSAGVMTLLILNATFWTTVTKSLLIKKT